MSRPFPDLGPASGAIDLPVRLSRGFRFSAWWVLFRISVSQFVRGKRLLTLALMLALPTLLAVVVRHTSPRFHERTSQVEELLVLYMFPQALVPLTGLIMASGMIRDEVEGQTLTYLLIRPLPRPAIYAAKLAAAWVVSAALAAVFVTALLVAIHWGADNFWGEVVPARALRTSALSALSLLVYVALFSGLSLVSRWDLPTGVAYIVVFEGLFANIDFMVRKLTVLWYVRILAERWLDLHVESWSIDLKTAPSGTEALVTLLTAALVLASLTAWLFNARELRMKTPEGE